ncbi:unnamed protein product [Ilex paraguariensis]|uniref:Uncharacterized protein n=1 Tax=Ilex paraguariensis TaxID=185542 RepID=A0ABC8V387_9AQUA
MALSICRRSFYEYELPREASTYVQNPIIIGTNEEVFDNSDTVENLAIPKLVLKEKILYPSSSSHDQRVPSIQISKNGLLNRKRPKPVEDERPPQDYLINGNNTCRTLKTDDDLCSTAESSSAKRQITCSRNSFSVPNPDLYCQPASLLRIVNRQNSSSHCKRRLTWKITQAEMVR